MKKLITVLLIAITIYSCKKEDETIASTTSVNLSGLKDGTMKVNETKYEPTQILFTGGNLEARNAGSTTLNDIIVEIGNSPVTGVYPVSQKTITAKTLRIEYLSGTVDSPIEWLSKSGDLSIGNNGTSVSADFKDIVFIQKTDSTKTVTISANLTGKIQ